MIVLGTVKSTGRIITTGPECGYQEIRIESGGENLTILLARNGSSHDDLKGADVVLRIPSQEHGSRSLIAEWIHPIDPASVVSLPLSKKIAAAA